MALDAYLTMTGDVQGRIEGSVLLKGREKTIAVYGWTHEVVSPRDAASGMSTGKRQHRPLIITKPVDRATPLLFNILTNNENISRWRLDCWQPSVSGRGAASGREVQFYTVELVNASIAEIRTEQLNNKYPENVNHELREHVAFTYQRITWTWHDGSVTAEDDWAAPIN